METPKVTKEMKRYNRKLKIARKTLDSLFMGNDEITSNTKLSDIKILYGHLEVYKMVPEIDLVEIYLECIMKLKKREDLERIKKRDLDLQFCFNVSLTYKTTWREAQKILWKFPKFVENEALMKMDKKEMLAAFNAFVKESELKEKHLSHEQRKHRKNRDHFNSLLIKMKIRGNIHSLSLWKDVHGFLKTKTEYQNMLGQSGSTPLDLFKFFVNDLKDAENLENVEPLEVLAVELFDEPMEVDEDIIGGALDLKMSQFDEIDKLTFMFANCNIRVQG